MKKIAEISILGIIWAIAFFMYLLPVSELPFGDVDASTHFALADTMGSTDKSLYWLPYQINQTYGFASNGKIWYPPQWHLGAASIQLFSGERIVGFFFFAAFSSSLIVFGIYLLVKELYGSYQAIIASLLAAFSYRDASVYLFSQWPQAISFYYVPLFLYFGYKAILDLENRKRYSVVGTLILASQFYFHPQGFIASLLMLVVFVLFISIKEKKLPFKFNELILPAVILIPLVLLFIAFPLGLTEELESAEKAPLSRLFSWYPDAENYKDTYPSDYFSYSSSHGLWTLPLLLLGIFYVLYRRRNQDMLILSMLVSYYLLLHLDVFGYSSRVPRLMQLESLIFYPLIAIGAISIASFFKQNKTEIKNIVFGVIIILILIFNASNSYQKLNSAFKDTERITKEQLEMTDWLRNNLPRDATISDFGTITLAKIKWLRQLSQRFVIQNPENPNYLLIDLSDLYSINAVQQIQSLESQEKSLNLTPIYDKNNIRVYQIG